jgi:hypothetical protein
MTVADVIRSKLDNGQLPVEPPEKRYAGYGRGETCDGCAETILPAQVAYELDYPKLGRTYYLHIGCAGLLEAERLRRGHRRSE